MSQNAKPISTIGSKELVDFPALGLVKIPAKIDTGADSSTIWSSDIHVTHEGLTFKLFKPGTRFYVNAPILASDYRTTTVKNSFGSVELRYKVNLVVRVGDRRIKGWFTLSDRSNMRYPVLLGRRLLKNKFIVDVGKSGSGKTKATKKALMHATPSDRTKLFAQGVAPHMQISTSL